ncbi:right-handed parallel beta-helix repeat-containing protein [Cerasicoccus arenae]|uniref:Right handed beta helix domain-containing protein n=1 Tax=Cerasicoccus arenae TaxID=424488 RepID=A0A8J3DI13_9BACT|nr:right-handed parallel beta-helix repeat-containing protein [Cerasicoccus arenae]MBK1859818.1 right-handed parallel beta-helix repeat-containing protein [Cerasicoccus arenae]GHC01546.1 hypothetical protein GCM10007047_17580 [Cerasicoccus arenae]
MNNTRFYVSIILAAVAGQFVQGSEPSDALLVLQSIPPAQASVVDLTPGRYELPTDGLLLEDLTDVTINAHGVSLIATNPKASALVIKNCRNLTIRGLTIDYDPLPFTQGSITAVNSVNRTADVTIHTGYPDLTADYLVKRMNLFEETDHRWKVGAPDYYLEDFEALDERHGRVHFRSSDAGFNHVEVGDRVAFNIRSVAGVMIKDRTEGLVLEDCTLHASPGVGILVRFAEDAGIYERLRVVPGPIPDGATEARLLSTSADGFNAAYTRIGPIISGCEFAYMGDDGVNLHGVVLPVLEWEDSRTCLSMRPYGGQVFDQVLRPGDEARFILEPNFQLVETAVIESIEQVAGSVEDWFSVAHEIWPSFQTFTNATFFRIRFEEPVLNVPAEGAFCEFFASAASGYVIENSYFHDHRARGLRLMAGNGVVENNRFERLKGVAISAGPEFAYWKEAGWVHDLTIKNNEISNVGQGADVFSVNSYTLGAISLYARVIPDGEQTQYFKGNENILIEGNVIQKCAIDAISIVASKDVIIRDNNISDVNSIDSSTAGSSYGLGFGQPIAVIQSDAIIESNAITELEDMLEVSVTSGKPNISEDIAYVNPADTNGLRFYWIEGDGRRALGQQFQVENALTATQLALEINSSTSNSDLACPLRLTFSRCSQGSPEPREEIATYYGVIPEGSNIHSNQWLCLEFPELNLGVGNYCFTIEFVKSGFSGRSIVLNVGSAVDAYSGGKGIQSPGNSLNEWKYGRPINFILSGIEMSQGGSGGVAPRMLKVDQRGGSIYASLSSAVADALPGDVINIAPGSGPYREPLYVNKSGLLGKPIVVEGNDETITGFEPLDDFRIEGGKYVCDINVPFPFVIRFQGERLLQDANNGQFTKYALLTEGNSQLELLPGVSRHGWEISTRYFAVRIQNASHHIYRNIRASGATNDGFNLHGSGEGLVFEYVEAFQNADEGFSAHDNMSCEIHTAAFYENDNGIGNVGASEMVASNVDVFNNLGWGLWLTNCSAVLNDISAWDNGMSQVYLKGSAQVDVSGVTAYEPTWNTRMWMSYKESANVTVPTPLIIDNQVQLYGESVYLELLPVQ